MNKELMDKFINGGVVVNTKTQDEYDWLMRYLYTNFDVRWPDGELPIKFNALIHYAEGETCIEFIELEHSYEIKCSGISEHELIGNVIVDGKDLMDKQRCYNEDIKGDFEKILIEMLTTYREKNPMYGDSFGKSVEKYGMISALTRISDKFNRLEQMILNDNDGTDDERLRDTLLDMASYCVMTIVELEREN